MIRVKTELPNKLWRLLLAKRPDEVSLMNCIYDQPELCSIPFGGDLPIHIAMEKLLNAEIINRMMKCYSQCCTMKNGHGAFLLHDLLVRQPYCLSRDIVMSAITGFPDAVQLYDGNGDFPIHIECMNLCRYDVIIELVEAYPTSLQLFGKFSQLPIHCVLYRKNCQPDLIAFIINHFPHAALYIDELGNLPLHLLCLKYGHRDMIVKLLEGNPKAIKVPDPCGRLPLHCALCNDLNQCETINFLIDYYPEAAGVHDKDGNYPLHIECSNQCRYEVIVKLVEIYPEAVRASNNGLTNKQNSGLPLDCAMINDHSSTGTAIYLINLYPRAARMRCIWSGNLYLHIECMNQCRYDVIALLLDSFPQAINKANDALDLALHIVMKREHPPKDVIYLFLRKYQDASNKPSMMNEMLPFSDMFKEFHDRYLQSSPSISFQLSTRSRTLMIDLLNFYLHDIIPSFNLTYMNGQSERYRLLLNLAFLHLSNPMCVDDYHDINYEPRCILLYLLLQLSNITLRIPSSDANTTYGSQLHQLMSRLCICNCNVNLALYKVLVLALLAAGRVEDHSTRYGWMKGDDLGSVLLRKVTLYL